MLIRMKKAQSTAEYAILLSIVVAAALAMQHEVRRTIQGRIHEACQELTGSQYEPQSGYKHRNTTADQTITETAEGDPFWNMDQSSDTSFDSQITQ